MALTAALKAAHAAVDDAVASRAAAEALVNKLRNTIAQLRLATRSSDAQPAHRRPRGPRRRPGPCPGGRLDHQDSAGRRTGADQHAHRR
jgi:hypothetical protein